MNSSTPRKKDRKRMGQATPEPPIQQMSREDLKATLEGARKMAKPSCKRCHGTGTMGTRVVSLQRRTILICHCVEKMASRIEAAQAAKQVKTLTADGKLVAK